MQHFTSDNCHTYAHAERLLYHAKCHLQLSAPNAAIPPHRRGFYQALRLLSMAQHNVLEEEALRDKTPAK